jgi:NAD(P) transhydrogenase subunit alpha
VLAVFVGYYVVWSVTPGAAHAADVGDQRDLLGDRRRRLLAVGVPRRRTTGPAARARPGPSGFGFVALAFAAVNIFGGFLVTQRMLAMYKKKDKK